MAEKTLCDYGVPCCRHSDFIKTLFKSFTGEQKSQLHTEFVSRMIAKNKSQDITPARHKFKKDINSVYKEGNLDKMQYYLNKGTLGEESVGSMSLIWFETLMDCSYEITQKGKLMSFSQNSTTEKHKNIRKE